jgi:3-oxoacyl-[acyl-carrier-protein] synthase III
MRIAGIAYQLGSKVESLAELHALNPDWRIEQLYGKVGIDKRYVSTAEETPLTLGVQAAEKLLEKVDRSSIDGVVYVTQTPDSLIPTTACLLHARLGLPARAFAFDVNQGCSGFVYGLSLATSLLDGHGLGRCLVVCAETYSKHIPLTDRTCRPIFSDGAAAVLVERDDAGRIGPFVFMTDGTGAQHLELRQSETGGAPQLFMDGPAVLLFTLSAVPRAVQDLLAKADIALDAVDLFVFHQASRVVIDNIKRALKLDEAKVFRNYQDMGNTVCATIPIALRQAEEAGRLGPGRTVMLVGFGVGLSLAACLVRT